jgi:hypothetical protein
VLFQAGKGDKMHLDVRILHNNLIADSEVDIGCTMLTISYEEKLALGRHGFGLKRNKVKEV